ncbi:LysR substrate-binding domain-containing protein [Hyphomicrobium sp. CS1BSMeth3]|uniref:LysR substrate-binding domain-containing protein n=1 Tax=Hyphomicrobium sp. CS1BSMeth3 TaxID=1892844 RepID=UPI00093112A8|nr:LysR substrate-binding domain-containing protein [Hyphomicrobium sp. CS1BSMeth3]
MSQLPPLIELRAFEAAARHLSFKQAAAELGVTPTAISHHIRLLERYCGCPLFRRRPRPLSLTEPGERLFPAIRDGLTIFAGAIAAVKQDAGGRPLRITTTNAFAHCWLVPRLPGWGKLRPDVPMEVIGTDAVLDLKRREADVAIRYARTAPVDGVAQLLATDSFYAYCRPALKAKLRRVTDLHGQVLVHAFWSPSDTEAPTWQRWLALAEQRWKNVPAAKEMQHLSFREELHALEAVLSGQGIGIFSDVLVASKVADGTLVKAFDLRLPGYQFHLVHEADHPRQQIIRAFASWLGSTVASGRTD